VPAKLINNTLHNYVNIIYSHCVPLYDLKFMLDAIPYHLISGTGAAICTVVVVTKVHDCAIISWESMHIIPRSWWTY
jgi:hypothetical protein